MYILEYLSYLHILIQDCGYDFKTVYSVTDLIFSVVPKHLRIKYKFQDIYHQNTFNYVSVRVERL